MRQIVHLFVISIILSLSIVLKGSNDEDKGKQEDDGVFKPTSDWQPLRKGELSTCHAFLEYFPFSLENERLFYN